MSTQTMAVALPEKAVKKIQPPPRKTEIIEALLRLEETRWNEEAERAFQRLTKAKEAAEKAIEGYVRSNMIKLKSVEIWRGQTGCPAGKDTKRRIVNGKFPRVSFTLEEDVPQKIIELIHEAEEAELSEYIRWSDIKEFDRNVAKKKIIAKLNGQTDAITEQRVNAMIKSPAIKRALEDTLATINGKTVTDVLSA